MKLINQIRYGIRILMDLALYQEGQVVQTGDIAFRQNLSMKYMEKLIRQLKEAGFIDSKRGRNGGHCLACSPDDISLADVVRIFETHPARPGAEKTCSYPALQDALIFNAWQEAQNAFYNQLGDVTLADLNRKTTMDLWDHPEALVFCD